MIIGYDAEKQGLFAGRTRPKALPTEGIKHKPGKRTVLFLRHAGGRCLGESKPPSSLSIREVSTLSSCLRKGAEGILIVTPISCC